jgi:hypothetical protein
LLEDAVAAERLANEVRRGRHFGEMLVPPMGAVNPGIPFRNHQAFFGDGRNFSQCQRGRNDLR